MNQEVLQAISTVGFPIVMCVIMYVSGQKRDEAFTKQLEKLNTSITRLLERVDKK